MHCVGGIVSLYILVIILSFLVVVCYGFIAKNYFKLESLLTNSISFEAARLRNIFIFCALGGYFATIFSAILPHSFTGIIILYVSTCLFMSVVILESYRLLNRTDKFEELTLVLQIYKDLKSEDSRLKTLINLEKELRSRLK